METVTKPLRNNLYIYSSYLLGIRVRNLDHWMNGAGAMRIFLAFSIQARLRLSSCFISHLSLHVHITRLQSLRVPIVCVSFTSNSAFYRHYRTPLWLVVLSRYHTLRTVSTLLPILLI